MSLPPKEDITNIEVKILPRSQTTVIKAKPIAYERKMSRIFNKDIGSISSMPDTTIIGEETNSVASSA